MRMSAPWAVGFERMYAGCGLGDDGSGGERHESSHYHSVVSNGHSSALKEKMCHFESAEG